MSKRYGLIITILVFSMRIYAMDEDEDFQLGDLFPIGQVQLAHALESYLWADVQEKRLFCQKIVVGDTVQYHSVVHYKDEDIYVRVSTRLHECWYKQLAGKAIPPEMQVSGAILFRNK